MSYKVDYRAGVYSIQNLVNGRVYIGSTAAKRGFRKRFSDHVLALNAGNHYSSLLQEDWNKLGASAFIFQILEDVPREEIIDRNYLFGVEQIWLDTCKAEYNTVKTAKGSFKHNTFEQREKANENTLNNLRAMAIARTGKPRELSEEHRQAIIETHRGKTVSEETRVKQSAAKKGKKQSEETKEKRRTGILKTWLLEHTDGRSLEVNDLKLWCLENNISYGGLRSAMYRNDYHQKSGWRLSKL